MVDVVTVKYNGYAGEKIYQYEIEQYIDGSGGKLRIRYADALAGESVGCEFMVNGKLCRLTHEYERLTRRSGIIKFNYVKG